MCCFLTSIQLNPSVRGKLVSTPLVLQKNGLLYNTARKKKKQNNNKNILTEVVPCLNYVITYLGVWVVVRTFADRQSPNWWYIYEKKKREMKGSPLERVPLFVTWSDRLGVLPPPPLRNAMLLHYRQEPLPGASIRTLSQPLPVSFCF